MRLRIMHPIKDPGGGHGLPQLPPWIDAEPDWLPEGGTTIECRADEALCVPPLLDRIRLAEQQGVDAVIVNCFMDPGVRAARELVRIPVGAPGEAAMTLATTVADTFSVVLPARSGAPIVTEQATLYVGRERLASVRGVEMPVADFGDHDRLSSELVAQAELAIAEDGAHAVVLGCTGMSPVAATVRETIAERGHDVPVLDPTLAAVGAVVAQGIAGIRHSGLTYELPSWRAVAAC